MVFGQLRRPLRSIRNAGDSVAKFGEFAGKRHRFTPNRLLRCRQLAQYRLHALANPPLAPGQVPGGRRMFRLERQLRLGSLLYRSSRCFLGAGLIRSLRRRRLTALQLIRQPPGRLRRPP